MVDSHGWLAAVTGMPPVDRVPLPDSFGAGHVWLPSLGTCVAEPMPGGWLLRVTGVGDLGSAGRVVLDLGEPRRPHITVSGTAGSWAQDLSPRHAELLYVLAVHRQGRSAAQLAVDLFGDPTRTVTVRAELSRVRRPSSSGSSTTGRTASARRWRSRSCCRTTPGTCCRTRPRPRCSEHERRPDRTPREGEKG